MFYYLLNHSSLLNKQNEKAKNLSIILFGSLVYLAIHAFLSFNKNTSIQKIKQYFWFMFLLDIVMSYYSFIHKSKDDNDNDNDNDNESTDNKKEHSFMEEIFSIKNKITEMISSNKNKSHQQDNSNNNNVNIKTNNKEKTDLQKEKDALILQLKEELTNSKNNNSENIKENIIKEESIKSTKKLSTPIKILKIKKSNIQQQQEQDNSKKEIINQEDKKINNTNKKEIDFNDSASESGSEMDFDISEFQNTLDE